MNNNNLKLLYSTISDLTDRILRSIGLRISDEISV